jgi:hypothetical protein
VDELGSSGKVQTTGSTTTTALAFTPIDGKTTRVHAEVVAQSAGVSASYCRTATFRRAGAEVTQIGVTSALDGHADAGAATWFCTIDSVDGQVRVRVTGAIGATIDWSAFFFDFGCP